MVTDTRTRIIEYIGEKHQARVHDLVKMLNISRSAVHRQLNKLVKEGELQKAGKPPLVFYVIPPVVNSNIAPIVVNLEQNATKDILEKINDNFLYITPEGNMLYGVEGCAHWINSYQKNKAILPIAQKYAELIEQKKKNSPEGWIDATQKLKDTYDEYFVDRLLFEDIYSYPMFGRTKLAKLVMHAKQLENKELIDKISISSKPLIEKIIKKYSINAVGFIPPTVPRTLQFMDGLATQLNIPLPRLNLVKILAGDIPIPQKTLTKLEDRVVNARSTIYLKNIAEISYPNILLIDDVAGSGASLNETARKLKALKIGYKNIIAFALVGNIKGYDVIRAM